MYIDSLKISKNWNNGKKNIKKKTNRLNYTYCKGYSTANRNIDRKPLMTIVTLVITTIVDIVTTIVITMIIRSS